MTSPAASCGVVIPAHNYGHLLGRALAAVAAQETPVAEVVVVDDGSTDDTPDVARAALAEHFSGRGTYLRQANAGAAVARNAGLARVRSEWVWFVDADDEPTPDALSKLSALAEKRPEAAIVFGGYRVVRPGLGPGGGDKLRDKLVAPDAVGPDRLANFRRFVRGELRGLTTGTALVRRDVAECHGFEPRCLRSQDRVFFGRVIAGHDVAAIPGEAGIVLRALRHAASLRKNADRMRRAEPFVVRALFDPNRLPPAAMALRAEFAGRYGVDVATNYFRNGWHARSRRAYERAVAAHPPQLLRLRPLGRYLRSTLAVLAGGDREDARRSTAAR